MTYYNCAKFRCLSVFSFGVSIGRSVFSFGVVASLVWTESGSNSLKLVTSARN